MSARGAVVKKKKKAISKSQRANVLFPVGRLHRFLKEGTHKFRIGVGAAVYAASVIEYLAAEVLELAGNTARDCKKSRITPRHILFAVATDKELHELLKGVTIASGGVLPHIHPTLFLKRKKGSSSLSLPASPQSPASPRRPIMAKTVKAVSKPTARKLKGVRTKGGTSLANLRASKTSGATGASPIKLRAKGIKISSLTSQANFTVLSEKKLFMGQKLTVVQSDITTVNADAVVHPTNGNFALLGEVGQALSKLGGQKLLDDIADVQKKVGTLASCDVAVSPTTNFAFPWVIHVNGPSHGDINAYDKLETSVKNCLLLADSMNLKSVALPSIGSGRAGFPKQQAAQTILKAVCNYFVTVMSSSLRQIYFVLFDQESIRVYTTELAKIDE